MSPDAPGQVNTRRYRIKQTQRDKKERKKSKMMMMMIKNRLESDLNIVLHI